MLQGEGAVDQEVVDQEVVDLEVVGLEVSEQEAVGLGPEHQSIATRHP